MGKFLLSIIFCLVSFPGITQCCSPGNPLGVDDNPGVLSKNSLRFMCVFKNSVSENYFVGDQRTNSNSQIEKGVFNFSGITLAYGISDKVTVENELGYFISKKLEYKSLTGNYELIGYGISDFNLIVKHNILSLPPRELEITAGAGYKMPVGQHQQKDENGVILPLDIQPTSGASGFIGTFFIHKGISAKNLKFLFTSRIQITPFDVIFNEAFPSRYYRFGNIYSASFFTSFNASHRLNFVIQSRVEIKDRDRYKYFGDNFYRIYQSSGARKIYLVPQVVLTFNRGLNASLMVDLPVYQFYNQKQLGNAYACSIVLSKVFNSLKFCNKSTFDDKREN